MKLNLKDLSNNVITSLAVLGNDTNTKKMSGKQIRALAKTIKIITSEVKDVQEIANNLSRQYAAVDNDGTPIMVNGTYAIKNAEQEEYIEKIKEIQDVSFEVPFIPIKWEQAEKMKLVISATALADLIDIFIIDDEVPEIKAVPTEPVI